MQPQLVEHNILKNLLKNSFNDIDIPFTTVVGKYSINLIKDNWFYFLIIILIIIISIIIMTKNEHFKSNNIKEEYIDKTPKPNKNKRKTGFKKEKYINTNEYYTNTPRI